MPIPRDFDALVKVPDDKNTCIKLQYKGFQLLKHHAYDMFYLRDVMYNIINDEIKYRTIEDFIHSYSFYKMLQAIDHDVKVHESVYLLMDKENKICKIGKSYNIKKRYDAAKLETDLVYVVHVEDMNVTEKKLIKKFKQIFGDPVKGNEYFSYTNAEYVKKEFNETVEHDRIVISNEDDLPQHFIRFKSRNNKLRGLWVSISVAEVLFSYFLKNETKRTNAFEFLKLVNIATNNDAYVYTVKNEATGSNCKYILFHKYQIIENENDRYVNGSCLYNSIRRADKTKIKFRRFKEFLDSDRFKHKIEQFKEVFPDLEPWYWSKNEKQKYLEGYYIHYVFVHFMIEDLDAKYAVHASILMYDIMTNRSLKYKIPTIIDQGLRYLAERLNEKTVIIHNNDIENKTFIPHAEILQDDLSSIDENTIVHVTGSIFTKMKKNYKYAYIYTKIHDDYKLAETLIPENASIKEGLCLGDFKLTGGKTENMHVFTSITDYLMQPYEPTIEHSLMNRLTLNRTHFDTYHMITLMLREPERYKAIVEKYKDITASIYDTDDETLHDITSDKDPIEKRYLRLKLRKIDPEIEYRNMKKWCDIHSETMPTLYRGERTNRFRGLSVGDTIEFTELFSSTEDEEYARKYITDGTVLVKDKAADAVLIIFKNILAAYLRLPFDEVTVYRKFTNKETPHNSFTWNEIDTEMYSNEYLSLQTSFKITKIEKEDVIKIYVE